MAWHCQDIAPKINPGLCCCYLLHHSAVESPWEQRSSSLTGVRWVPWPVPACLLWLQAASGNDKALLRLIRSKKPRTTNMPHHRSYPSSPEVSLNPEGKRA